MGKIHHPHRRPLTRQQIQIVEPTLIRSATQGFIHHIVLRPTQRKHDIRRPGANRSIIDQAATVPAPGT